MQLQQVCQNPAFNVKFFENMCSAIPVLGPKAELPSAAQSAAFDVLTDPQLDQLRFFKEKGNHQKLAESVISKLTAGDLKGVDCKTLNKLGRQIAAVVHPDKSSSVYGKKLAHQAAVNLNNARDALGC